MIVLCISLDVVKMQEVLFSMEIVTMVCVLFNSMPTIAEFTSYISW